MPGCCCCEGLFELVAGRADVHVVPIKNVKKPKGAKRGLVYVTGGKSIHLRREEARLARLLASKLDD